MKQCLASAVDTAAISCWTTAGNMLELLWRRSESKEAFTVLPSEPIGLRTADVSKAKAVDLFSEFGELWLLDLTESAERFCILSVLEAFLSLGQGKFMRGVR